jgi:hypothetical protein
MVLAACGAENPNTDGVDAGTGDAGSADAAAEIDAAENPREPSRYYGNVPISMTPAGQASFTPQHIAEDSNMLVLHFDFFGVPWQEFGNDETLPPAWVAQMDSISQLQDSLALPVFLALTPLAGTRDRLAPAASGGGELVLDEGFGVRCEDIGYRGDYATLRSGYAAYVDYMIERFDPLFVALSIEVNLYAEACPEGWATMKTVLNEVYAGQKAKRGGLPIFHTFQIDSLWGAGELDSPCLGFADTCIDENLLPLADLDTDIFAISSYPLPTYVNNGKSLPDNWFSIFAEKTGLPLAIAETGYQFYPITVEHPVVADACFEALPTSGADQQAYLQRVLAAGEALDMPFVTWWGNHDLIPPQFSEPCRCEEDEAWCDFLNALGDYALLYRFFATMGLRDYDGSPRPALEPWAAAVSAAEP